MRFFTAAAIVAAVFQPGINGLQLSSNGTATADLPTATLDSGVIVGTTTSVASATVTSLVYQFLGVPFAVSPPKRFAPPEPVESWRTSIDTQKRAPACIQQINGDATTVNITKTLFIYPDSVESEDCLYLNVFVPATATKDKAVLNWVFPGNLLFGDASRPQYDGSSFAANHDVIVVAGNYRTNVFGFSNAPELPITERNAGFYDQRLVLDWIQRNIAVFGGSPYKVTLFGESSGASSIDRLVYTANSSTNPFRAAIAQSGSASVSASPDHYETSWPVLVNLTNCTNATSQLECVRAVDAVTIQSLIEANTLIFGPENDNITQYPTPTLYRRTEHISAPIPYLLGNNGGEGYPFMLGFTSVQDAILYDLYNPTADQVAAIEAAYPVTTDPSTNTTNTVDVIAQIFTDIYFQCPVGYITRASADADYPVWRYFFNQSYPNLQLLSGLGIDLHSYHTIEASLVFGTYPTEGATSEEVAMSRFFQETWAGFAKDPYSGPGWIQVQKGGNETSETKDVGEIGKGNVPGITLISERELDSRCALYEPQYSTVDHAAF